MSNAYKNRNSRFKFTVKLYIREGFLDCEFFNKFNIYIFFCIIYRGNNIEELTQIESLIQDRDKFGFNSLKEFSLRLGYYKFSSKIQSEITDNFFSFSQNKLNLKSARYLGKFIELFSKLEYLTLDIS